MLLGFVSLGPLEILLIFLAVLLLFGPKRIPDIARALGRASREFKKAKDDIVKSAGELADTAEKDAEGKDDAGNGK
ncbi:MAG: twin-arginine translocase TatA/TatE family subunit [Victivallales bacterium]|nr:twin-arginine translocase TatA/TatE family subunit [Victivallales bacterium]